MRGKPATQETPMVPEPAAEPAEEFELNGQEQPQDAETDKKPDGKPKARRMVLSVELQAIQDIQDILGNLSPAAKKRVWRWVSECEEVAEQLPV